MPLTGPDTARSSPGKRMGKPRRSKGCTTCIKRKVKCDEKVPSCGQCLKGGRKCSGVASAIFMNMDSTTLSTTSTFAPRDLVDVVESPESPHSQTPPSAFSSIIIKNEAPDSPGIAIVPSQQRKATASPEPTYLELAEQGLSPKYRNFWVIPPPIQNSQMLNQQFLSHFINFFALATPRDVIFNSWMARLPEMLASLNHRIDKSIAAASMMYYGRRTNDKTIMMEAYKSYGAALLSQRKTLQDIFNGKREPTIEELCVPLLLSFFEISCCTSQTAYFQHLCGAGTLIELYGPEKCSEGILFEIFHALRLQLNYASIVLRFASPFSTKPWLTLPFTNRTKTPIDHLVDTITTCTSLIARIDAFAHLSPASRTAEHHSILASALDLKTQLDTTWPGLRPRAASQGWDGDYFNGVPGFDDPLHLSPTATDQQAEAPRPEHEPATSYPCKSPTSSLPLCPQSSPIREPFSSPGTAARPLGFYSTARLLVLSILHSLDAAPPLYEAQMEAHCASILATTEFMRGLEVGFAYLRLILPMQVVGTLSPVREQREKARGLVRELNRKAGLGGLCVVALEGLGVEEAERDQVGELEGEDGSENGAQVTSRPNTHRVPMRMDWWKKKEAERRRFGYKLCTPPQEVSAHMRASGKVST